MLLKCKILIQKSRISEIIFSENFIFSHKQEMQLFIIFSHKQEMQLVIWLGIWNLAVYNVGHCYYSSELSYPEKLFSTFYCTTSHHTVTNIFPEDTFHYFLLYPLPCTLDTHFRLSDTGTIPAAHCVKSCSSEVQLSCLLLRTLLAT